MVMYGRSLRVVHGIFGTTSISTATHVPPLKRSNSWSSGVSLSIGGSALALKVTRAVTVAIVFVSCSHADVVVFIAAYRLE